MPRRTVPADTEMHILEGKGHSLTIDTGWKDVADVASTGSLPKAFSHKPESATADYPGHPQYLPAQ
jgi:hypothetical protein